MDPDVTLSELRELTTGIFEENGAFNINKVQDTDDVVNLLVQISERFEALDEWISKGGYAPRDWALK
jgi:hypothetical protein